MVGVQNVYNDVEPAQCHREYQLDTANCKSAYRYSKNTFAGGICWNWGSWVRHKFRTKKDLVVKMRPMVQTINQSTRKIHRHITGQE